jgi:hypothetical protein
MLHTVLWFTDEGAPVVRQFFTIGYAMAYLATIGVKKFYLLTGKYALS